MSPLNRMTWDVCDHESRTHSYPVHARVKRTNAPNRRVLVDEAASSPEAWLERLRTADTPRFLLFTLRSFLKVRVRRPALA